MCRVCILVGCFISISLLPPERGDMFIRETAFLFIYNQQFVLQLFWLHGETFEENTCGENKAHNKVTFLSKTKKKPPHLR